MLENAINERVEEIAKQKYFLTFSELSKYLNISRPLIEDRLIKNGLNFYRIGSKYLFKREEVDEFLDYMTANMNIYNNDIKLFGRLESISEDK